MKNGFTLVELVVTIIIISILGTFAFVRFSGTSGFAEFAFQERLVSALRNIQQRAMQDTAQSGAYTFNFSTSPPAAFPLINGLSVSTDINDDFLSILSEEINEEGVSLSLNGLPSSNVISFDSLGRPQNGAMDACANGCVIDFIGEQAARVCIEPEGYIHKGDCG
jgi:MSHA pilin protein MshC